MSSSCDSPILIKPSRTTQKKNQSVFASMQKTRHDADYGANLIRCSVRKNPHQLLKPILECKTPIQMKQTLQIPLNESINLKWDEVVDYFKDPNQFRVSSQTSIIVDALEVESQKLKELYFTKKVQKEQKPKAFSMTRYKRISKFLNSVKKPSSDKSIVSLKCIEVCTSQEQRIRQKSIQKIQEFQQRIGLKQKTIIQNEIKRQVSISETRYEDFNILMEDKHQPPTISSRRSIHKIQDFTGRVEPRKKTIIYNETQNQIPSELEVEKLNHQIKTQLSNSVETNQEYQGRINKKQKTLISIDTNISQSQITYEIKSEQYSTQLTVQVQEKPLISFTSKSVQPKEELQGDNQKPKFCSHKNINDKGPFSSGVKARSTMAKQGFQKQKTIFSDTSMSRSHLFTSRKSEQKIQLYPGANQNNSINRVTKIGDQIEALTISQGLPQVGSQKKNQKIPQSQFRIQKWFL